MKIDGNVKEKQAMDAFNVGDHELGNKLQDEFLAEFHESLKNKEDHCPCQSKTCKHHGHCMDCVMIHRAHRDHIPVCLHDMVNERLAALCAITESSVTSDL